jgi:hypothetical protein
MPRPRPWAHGPRGLCGRPFRCPAGGTGVAGSRVREEGARRDRTSECSATLVAASGAGGCRPFSPLPAGNRDLQLKSEVRGEGPGVRGNAFVRVGTPRGWCHVFARLLQQRAAAVPRRDDRGVCARHRGHAASGSGLLCAASGSGLLSAFPGLRLHCGLRCCPACPRRTPV